MCPLGSHSLDNSNVRTIAVVTSELVEDGTPQSASPKVETLD